jgi:hypothetical protein
MMACWLKALLVVLVAAALLYMVFVVNELGSVPVPKFEAVKPENPKHLSEEQGWPEGWKPNQAQWFHHASQGTRILPYLWFVNLEKPTLLPSGKIIDPGYLERFGFLTSLKNPELNPDGLPVGFAKEDNFDAPYANPPSTGPVVGLTCAACHTGQITYRDETAGNVLKGIRVEGGSAMINLSEFQEVVGRAIECTLAFSSQFERFARNVLADQKLGEPEFDEKKAELKSKLQQFLDAGLEAREYARVHKLNGTDGGFGRTDALGLIGNRVFLALGNENLTVPTAPVNFPPLWDTSWFDWVQYNASIRMPMVRNIGEALGVGAAVNLNEETGTTASQSGKPLFASTVNVQNLYHLEEQIGGKTELGGLQSPKMKDTGLWDPGPEAENWRNLGKPLYVQYCQKCHLAPIEDLKKDLKNEENWFLETESGKRVLRVKTFDLQEIGTDPNQAMNFYRRVAIFEGKTTSAAQGLFAVTEFIRRDNYVKLGVTDKEKILEYNRYRKFDEGTPDDVKAGKYIGEALVANFKYKARPLDGIWATPPYLHNGSVPNLHQMLVPVECRDKSFYLGTTLYDKKHGGFVTEQFSGGFLLDTSLPGNSNAGHEFRNLTLEELERTKGISYSDPDKTPSRRRWITVLALSDSDFDKLTPSEVWEKTRKATANALEIDWVKRDHPFKGVLGPEFREDEREELLEYLKSL